MEGDVCTDGQCATQVATTTMTTTATSTVTHFDTEIASVEVHVDETSPVVSTLVITTSHIDIATEVTYTTTTMIEKRAFPANSSSVTVYLFPGTAIYSVARFSSLIRTLLRSSPEDDDSGSLSPFAPRSDPVPWAHPRKPRLGVRVKRASSTITSMVTIIETTDMTIIASSTVTTSTTSIAVTNSTQSRIGVLDAKHTISVTSTIVETSEQPMTKTRTSITTISAGGVSETLTKNSRTSSHPPDPTTSPNGSSRSLSPTTIIGIGVGSAIATILLFGILFGAWRLRRKRKTSSELWEPPRPEPGTATASAPQQLLAPPSTRHAASLSPFTRPPRSLMATSN
ncbi:hypothetical protein BJ170DRAFT_727810 [Xylariales sp. AK1849]|nr:hypothetical protein BJ170DRAFT_727810 [Xylariales sp. AK1849]